MGQWAGRLTRTIESRRGEGVSRSGRKDYSENFSTKDLTPRFPPHPKVRNGFVPQVRREVYRKFKGLEIDTCPFANLPEKKRTMWALTREEMKNCRWLRPGLVAQIEFAAWTPDNHLRHSSSLG
jgi:ATP-dependent DNA ligase